MRIIITVSGGVVQSVDGLDCPEDLKIDTLDLDDLEKSVPESEEYQDLSQLQELLISEPFENFY